MKNKRTMVVQGHDILIGSVNESDYINLTQLAEAGAREGQDVSQAVANWMRIRNTLDYLAIWEKIHGAHENFSDDAYNKHVMDSSDNSFSMSPLKWIQTTNAIGIEVKRGRVGGVYAHQTIALAFCAWLSPVFNLYVVQEFERLKEAEQRTLDPEWTVRRVLAANNLRIQTDAVRDYELPRRNLPQKLEGIAYADEAETLNIALFHITSKQWKQENPTLALQGKNLRDYATINELIVLSNLEGFNATLIKENNPRPARIKYLTDVAADQLKSLSTIDTRKSMTALQNRAQLNPSGKPTNKLDIDLKAFVGDTPLSKSAKRSKPTDETPSPYNDPE